MPELVAITLTPPTGTLHADSYLQLEATGEYDDTTTRPLEPEEVHYSTSDDTIAVVSNTLTLSGRVFGVDTGTVTITATSQPATVDSIVETAALTVTAPGTSTVPAGRFNLGFGSATLNPYPAWTAIDAHPNLVTSYSIDRGRSYELDQTDGGTATVEIMDPEGILDPSNPTGPHYGQIRPLLPALLCRRNPVTGTWEERFRGYVEDYSYDVDPSQRVNKLTVSLVDLFEIAGNAEMQPGQFGSAQTYMTGSDTGPVPVPVEDGQVFYPGGVRPDQRIAEILVDLGLPRNLWAVLPGNVHLMSSTYSPGEPPLTALQEAADGEFPHVANLFCDRHGRICFHNRTSRFDPAGAAAAAGAGVWDYHAWQVGDGAAVNAHPTTHAQVRALSFQRGVSKIINAATAIESGAADDAATKQRVTDTASINTYGIRSWSEQDLLTLRGDITRTHPTPAAVETKRFATYYVQNYKQPQTRINQITFRSLHPNDARAPVNWQLLTKIDVGDTLQITVATPGGGGFNSAGYFVEGVHEEARPLDPGYDDVTVTLDLSPRTYYTFDPWATPLTAPDSRFGANINDWKKRKRRRKRPRHRRSHPHSHDHALNGPDPFQMPWESVGTGAGGGGLGGGVEVVPYSISGDLEVGNGGLRYYALSDGVISQVYASVGTPASGTGVTVRVNRNGLSIGSVEILAGENTAVFAPADPSVIAGDYFTVDITATGTGASDLVVELQVESA